ncbi:hypothetical protein N0V90_010893 [Kalmusia sp. IMI 367209]|nr:hypothetical protein N0V90_010893 [Kalmusia sp. IMI 367209]
MPFSATPASKLAQQAQNGLASASSLFTRSKRFTAYLYGEAQATREPYARFLLASGILATGAYFRYFDHERYTRNHIQMAVFHIIRVLEAHPDYDAMVSNKADWPRIQNIIDAQVNRALDTHVMTQEEGNRAGIAIKRKLWSSELAEAHAHKVRRLQKDQEYDDQTSGNQAPLEGERAEESGEPDVDEGGDVVMGEASDPTQRTLLVGEASAPVRGQTEGREPVRSNPRMQPDVFSTSATGPAMPLIHKANTSSSNKGKDKQPTHNIEGEQDIFGQTVRPPTTNAPAPNGSSPAGPTPPSKDLRELTQRSTAPVIGFPLAGFMNRFTTLSTPVIGAEPTPSSNPQSQPDDSQETPSRPEKPSHGSKDPSGKDSRPNKNPSSKGHRDPIEDNGAASNLGATSTLDRSSPPKGRHTPLGLQSSIGTQTTVLTSVQATTTVGSQGGTTSAGRPQMHVNVDLDLVRTATSRAFGDLPLDHPVYSSPVNQGAEQNDSLDNGSPHQVAGSLENQGTKSHLSQVTAVGDGEEEGERGDEEGEREDEEEEREGEEGEEGRERKHKRKERKHEGKERKHKRKARKCKRKERKHKGKGRK